MSAPPIDDGVPAPALRDVVIAGRSMAPTFDVGDVVRIAAAELGDVRGGDVVVLAGREPICHRVIAVVRAAGRAWLVHGGDAGGGLGIAGAIEGRVVAARRAIDGAPIAFQRTGRSAAVALAVLALERARRYVVRQRGARFAKKASSASR